MNLTILLCSIVFTGETTSLSVRVRSPILQFILISLSGFSIHEDWGGGKALEEVHLLIEFPKSGSICDRDPAVKETRK